jgi:hypothetical protein
VIFISVINTKYFKEINDMAKAKGGANGAVKVTFKKSSVNKRTSIGNAKASRPKNKNVRRSVKTYRGQDKL